MKRNLNLYIAGALEDKLMISSLIKDLSISYNITHDWTKYETQQSTLEDIQRYAIMDFNGILYADVVIIYISGDIYNRRGTSTEFVKQTLPIEDGLWPSFWVEFGIALGLSKKIIFLFARDESVYPNIFLSLPNHNISKVKTIDQLKKYLYEFQLLNKLITSNL